MKIRPKEQIFTQRLESWARARRDKGIVVAFLPETRGASSTAIAGKNIIGAAQWQGIPMITVGLAAGTANSFMPANVSLCFENQRMEINLQGMWQEREGRENPAILLSWPGLGCISWQGGRLGQREALRQAFVLGIGGMIALHSLGISNYISHYYLDGEIAALAMLQAIRIKAGNLDKISRENLYSLRQDFSIRERQGSVLFSKGLVGRAINDLFLRQAIFSYGLEPSTDNISFAKLSERLLGMGETTRKMSGIALKLNSIFHAAWAAPALAGLLDKYFPYWKQYPGVLSKLSHFVEDRNFRNELWDVHRSNKQAIFMLTDRKDLDPDLITVGFGGEKSSLVWGQLITREDFKSSILMMGQKLGGLQIIFFHSPDFSQREEIRQIISAGKQLETDSGANIKFTVVPAKEENVGTVLAGVDLWLDSPNGGEGRPSVRGMIAISNGVLNIVPRRQWLSPKSIDSREILTAFFEGLQALRSRESQIDLMIRLISEIEMHPETAERIQTAYARRWRPDWMDFSGMAGYSSDRQIAVMMDEIDQASARITANPRISNIEKVVAESLIKTLGACRITRYRVRNAHIRIEKRWEQKNDAISSINRKDIAESGFFNWRHISEFSRETMGQLFMEERMQMIEDPLRYQGCYRDGKLVSASPFILVPERIAGEICGVVKIDFKVPGELRGTEQEKNFIRTLMRRAEQTKTSLLWQGLRDFFRNARNEKELIDRLLISLTAGGFLGVPQYTTMNNRCVIFIKDNEGQLRPSRAIGETNGVQFWSKLAEMGKDLKKQKVWRNLRANPPHDSLESVLKERCAGLDSYIPPFVVEIRSGRAVRSEEASDKKMGFNRLAGLMERVEDLFQIRGQESGEQVKDYLLVPLSNEKGEEFGLIYVDNAFTKERFLVEKIAAIAGIAANRLTTIRQS